MDHFALPVNTGLLSAESGKRCNSKYTNQHEMVDNVGYRGTDQFYFCVLQSHRLCILMSRLENNEGTLFAGMHLLCNIEYNMLLYMF